MNLKNDINNSLSEKIDQNHQPVKRHQSFFNLSDDELNRLVAQELDEPAQEYASDLTQGMRLAAMEYIMLRPHFTFETWSAAPMLRSGGRIIMSDWLQADEWRAEAFHPSRAIVIAFLLIRGVLKLQKIGEERTVREELPGVKFNLDVLHLYHQYVPEPAEIDEPSNLIQ